MTASRAISRAKHRRTAARHGLNAEASRKAPRVLVLVAPLLSFHRRIDRLLAMMPPTLPLVEIGINQGWKREIKVLRRKGTLR